MDNENPFELWSNDLNAPREDEQHQKDLGLYAESRDANGKVHIQIFPSVMARTSAAIIAGQFQALLDTKVFTNEQAFTIIVQSLSGVIIQHQEEEDEDD